ncbi:hypothetical protein C499_10804 [Halogeometricum borinquense DSM 11551]|uniref:DUF8080 domain-containing protein n=2 Tax=Halogeometricum borinquense TaxID=60847 RepID=E4NRL3_HALBP|nr:hypothetical protein [Halogeometricum borinquense]ADQ65689.1 hypothetical protein Hbor_00760 [Halogeometricum borinquense DSM 11551]ELY27019.1 hypothetical protein C499_10804 [Halogeometricum borinquense DSM 11551]RYJ15121.1 hypothetical protein ELS19_14990 [Halogeometricum borinquense]
MEYDCTTKTVGGTTLVTVHVRNEAAVPRRVRVRNDLPGPVLPPRQDGVPERGWDDDGYTGVIAADDELTLGYACPGGDETETPVSVESLGRADEERDTEKSSRAELEAEAIRSLGRARPPADAVPTPSVDRQTETDDAPTDAQTRDLESRAESVSTNSRPQSEPESTPRQDSGGDSDDATSHNEGDEEYRAEKEITPKPVESWLSAVETRVQHAETVTDATADEAAAVLETAENVSDLPATVAADEDALRAFAARATALAERAADTDAKPVIDALGDR